MADPKHFRIFLDTPEGLSLHGAYPILTAIGEFAASEGSKLTIRLAGQRGESDGILNDLAWLGFSAADPNYEFPLSEEVIEILSALGEDSGLPGEPVTRLQHISDDVLEKRQYSASRVARQVAIDAATGVTDVLAHESTLPDARLYEYFCQRLGLAVPRQIFMPGLIVVPAPDVGDYFPVNLQALREHGWTTPAVHMMLRSACLKEPDLGWSLANVRAQPLIVLDRGNDNGQSNAADDLRRRPVGAQS